MSPSKAGHRGQLTLFSCSRATPSTGGRLSTWVRGAHAGDFVITLVATTRILARAISASPEAGPNWKLARTEYHRRAGFARPSGGLAAGSLDAVWERAASGLVLVWPMSSCSSARSLLHQRGHQPGASFTVNCCSPRQDVTTTLVVVPGNLGRISGRATVDSISSFPTLRQRQAVPRRYQWDDFGSNCCRRRRS